MATIIANLEKMLAQGQDSAMLRLSLGNAYLKDGDAPAAVVHLARAVELDAGYSAAWKSFGKALTAAGQLQQALAAYERGIEAARGKGDVQAAKEMEVFRKRLVRDLDQ